MGQTKPPPELEAEAKERLRREAEEYEQRAADLRSASPHGLEQAAVEELLDEAALAARPALRRDRCGRDLIVGRRDHIDPGGVLHLHGAVDTGLRVRISSLTFCCVGSLVI